MRSAAVNYAPSAVGEAELPARAREDLRPVHAGRSFRASVPGDGHVARQRRASVPTASASPARRSSPIIDHIGRVEGVVTRTLQDGFAMTVIASDRKKDKLAAQLTWLANKHELDLPEDRRHERVAPRNPMSVMQAHGWPPVSMPHHRPFPFRRRGRDRRQAGAWDPGDARHDARPGGAPLRGRCGNRIRRHTTRPKRSIRNSPALLDPDPAYLIQTIAFSRRRPKIRPAARRLARTRRATAIAASASPQLLFRSHAAAARRS